MRIRVRYHHRIKDLTGTESETVQLDEGATVADLQTRLCALCVALSADLSAALIARNEEYCDRSSPLADGDVVDIMPPLCGG